MEATGYDLLDLATALGRVKHAGQVRKGSGEPYFNHLTRVAGRVVGWRAKTIAYLHDLIEDTNITAKTLFLVGFPYDLVQDVEALSRKVILVGGDALDGPTDTADEPYFDFIERGIRDGSDDALYVKLADVADNLYDDWTQAQDTSFRARYIKADVMIRTEILRRGLPVPLTLAAE
jgi:hypothetical protein